MNRDGTMQRRKMSRKTGRVKRAGAAGMLILLALCLLTGCAGRKQKAITSLERKGSSLRSL